MRVAIIGAGVSGIAALKCCSEEGLEAVCFEQRESFGGLWVHRSKPAANDTSVTQQVICNTSKEMMAFSDFPPPEAFPLYMPQKKYTEYLQLYVKHFELESHMKFNTKVNKCDYKDSKWILEVEDLRTNVITEEHFDAVMLCNGINRKAKWPNYPGISDFSGQLLHAQQYRKASDFSGKNVLVIGMGNTATETAVELTTEAGKVYLSARAGKWICKRLTPSGLPTDIHLFRKLRAYIMQILPRMMKQFWLKNFLSLNHKFFGLDQDSTISAKTLTMSDDVINKLVCGKLILKSNVERFDFNEISFVDGTKLTDIDAVICGTGYELDYSFLAKSLLTIKNSKLFAYKHVLPPELIDKKLAVIGCISVFGAVAPLYESQCRLATRVFKGLVKLPPKEDMLKDIATTIGSQRNVDVIAYQDELCELIGCKPNIKRLLLEDLFVGLNVLLGPCTSYQFRLTGPGKWIGAKSAILNQWSRMYYPTSKHWKATLTPWTSDFLKIIIRLMLMGLLFILLLTKLF